MAFLTDTDLERIISRSKNNPGDKNNPKLIIDPYDENSLTPVGYDLRVGDRYVTSDTRSLKEVHPGEKVISIC